jgi:GTP diphosphokinase / guanosine-3',5'-bis(diphosphate) 3'-diphosphatase
VSELLARVGSAEVSARDVVEKLFPALAAQAGEAVDTLRPVVGLDPDTAFRRANCCQPLPGERIVGITYRGKGVVAHAIDCDVLAGLGDQPDRWIDLRWNDGRHPAIHGVTLELMILNSAGVLGRVCTLIGGQKANITDLRFVDRKPDFFRLVVELDVSDAAHLHRILTLLESDGDVAQVSRYRDPTRQP